METVLQERLRWVLEEGMRPPTENLREQVLAVALAAPSPPADLRPAFLPREARHLLLVAASLSLLAAAILVRRLRIGSRSRPRSI